MREIKFKYVLKDKVLGRIKYWRISLDVLEKTMPDYHFDTERLDIIDRVGYTGLKDRNGKEIYEGDIVTCPSIINYPKCIVKFGEHNLAYNGWYVQQGETQAELNSSWTTMGEVIGNIYENPELIKE